LTQTGDFLAFTNQIACFLFLFITKPCFPFLKTISTDKKENHIFLIYKEIQRGAVIYDEGLPTVIYEEMANISPYMRRPLVICDFATAPF
jgi:hypothetical protein